MKKIGIAALVFIGMVLGLWIGGQATNIFRYFTSPSGANEPTLKRGKVFFVSNLVKPKLLDFICFYATTERDGRHARVYRLCGTEGDTVEIRQGTLFVNGKNVDKGLNLCNEYFIAKKDYDSNQDVITTDEDEVGYFGDDSCSVPISDTIISERKIGARKLIFRKDSTDDNMAKIFHGNYNADNFGPLVVPPGKYFLLGDNRHRAEDSRYLGFIDKRDYMATVLWRK